MRIKFALLFAVAVALGAMLACSNDGGNATGPVMGQDNREIEAVEGYVTHSDGNPFPGVVCTVYDKTPNPPEQGPTSTSNKAGYYNCEDNYWFQGRLNHTMDVWCSYYDGGGWVIFGWTGTFPYNQPRTWHNIQLP